MDVFKLAFETIIVGLLTFVWLGLATYLLFPVFLTNSLAWIKSKASIVDKYKTAVGLGILTLAYCLGSAILPVAKQLVNDEHWPFNEDGIRCQVFIEQNKLLKTATLPSEQDTALSEPCHCFHWAPIFTEQGTIGERIRRFWRLAAPLPWETDKKEESNTKLRDKVLTLFQQQEANMLLTSENTELLRQLYERIVVLRGAVFSGFVFLLISLSGYFARINGGISHWTHWIRPVCGIMLGVIFTAFGLLNGIDDFKRWSIFDIPVLESLLLVITIFGVVVVIKGAKTPLLRSKRYALVALFFTGLTYGGWLWSEILYDQQVINSFAVLRHESAATKQTR